MKTIQRLTVVAALVGGAWPVLGHAQSSLYGAASDVAARAPWYILPSASIFDPDNSFGVDRRGEGFGLRVGRVLSTDWDVQFGPSFASSSKGGTELQRTTLDVTGMYMFSRNRFRPFVFAGLGAEYDKVKSTRPNASATSPFVTAGLGFQYSFSETWGMQADVRRTHSYLQGDAFGFKHANSNLFTLALTYAFGGKAVAAPMAQREAPAPYVAPAPAEPPMAAAPAPVAPAPVMPPVATPPVRMERITLSAMELFGFDSVTLPASHPKLDELIDYLKRDDQIKSVVITGYTDRIGSPSYNQGLSQRRADAVKQYMVDKGIMPNRMSAVGKGEENPVVTCTEKKLPALIQCLQPNRRVEIDKIVVERQVP